MEQEVFVDLKLYPHHLQELIDFDKNYFPFSWTKADWQNVMQDEHKSIFGQIDETSGKIVCFALFQNDIFLHQNHLLKICVLPEWRKRNIAKNVLEKSFSLFLARGYTNCYLEVSVLNEPAILLYRMLSFKILVEKESYYSDGSAAYAMQLVY